MMDRAEKSFGPSPNDQTILPDGSVSMTRLLNWSGIRTLPSWLKSRFNFRLSAETVPARARTPMAVRRAREAAPADFLRNGLIINIFRNLFCSDETCDFGLDWCDQQWGDYPIDHDKAEPAGLTSGKR